MRSTMVGTEGYQAPEMLRGEGHSFPVDWWSLGILAYDMIITVQPFYDETAIKEGPIYFSEDMSEECKDFISKLLVKDPEHRLGTNGAEEVLAHPWLSVFDHQQILERGLDVPIKPTLSEDTHDVHYFAEQFTTLKPRESVIDPLNKSKVKEYQDKFKNFGKMEIK